MANSTNFLIQIKQQGADQAIQQMQPLIATLNELGNVTVRITPGMNQLAGSNKNLASALAGLTSRALLTIPVWMALREAFMGGIRIFDESTRSIVDIDTAMKHLEMQLVGTAGAAHILAQVKINAQNLALQTGEAPATLIDVFNQLVTVGFSVQDAFKGMDTAAKGALVTNTDSADITNVLVNVYKELGNSITAVHSPGEKLNYILDTMTVLMQKNHLSIKDFEASLKTFAGQAAASNLTLDQTMSLIAASANVSQTGQFAGRGLTGIFRQITLQRAGVEDFLGKATGGQTDFQTFQDVLTKFQSIKPTDTGGLEAISKIFSLRGGGQSLRALAEDAEHLTANLKLLYGLTPDERQAVFAGRLTIALAMIQHQGEILKQTIEALGRTFITDLTGINDYGKALTNLNNKLLELKPTVEFIAKTLHLIAEAGGFAVKAFTFVEGFNFTPLNQGPTAPTNVLATLVAMQAVKNSQPKSTATTSDQVQDNTQNISQNEDKIALTKAQQVAQDEQLKSLGYSKLEILGQQLALLKQQYNGDETALEVQKAQAEYQKEYYTEIAEANKAILSTHQDILKSQGATTAQLLDQKEADMEALGIHQSSLQLLMQELEKEKAISDEKHLQNKLGADSLKLFDIAKRYGPDVAKQIGGVLQGQTSFDSFAKEGGRAFQVFKQQFPQEFKQQQAQQFFKGQEVTGLSNLTGGKNIPIAEQAIRGISSDYSERSLTYLQEIANNTGNHLDIGKRSQSDLSHPGSPVNRIADSLKRGESGWGVTGDMTGGYDVKRGANNPGGYDTKLGPVGTWARNKGYDTHLGFGSDTYSATGDRIDKDVTRAKLNNLSNYSTKPGMWENLATPFGQMSATEKALKNHSDKVGKISSGTNNVSTNITINVADWKELESKLKNLVQDAVSSGLRTPGSKIQKSLAYAQGGADNQTV